MVDGDKGKRYALIAVAEYALSKRTQVYGTVDYNKVRDASTGDISGRTSQVGGGLGIAISSDRQPRFRPAPAA